MRELHSNQFFIASERDHLKYESKKPQSSHSSSMENSTEEQYSDASLEAVSNDTLFRDKLKHINARDVEVEKV